MTDDQALTGVTVGTHRVARRVGTTELAAHASALFADGYRLGLVAAHDDGPTLRVVYLFLEGSPDRRVELQVSLPAANPLLPSLAALSFPAARFERELHDLYGIVPVDHPLPRRLVRHAHWPAGWYPMRRDAGARPPFTQADSFPFLAVEGSGVYEMPVGPVHAGVIEPGHFRFSVVGESIIKLKIRLWFTHRGIEKLFEGLDAFGAIHLAERIADPAHRLRSLLVELERLYNHAADLGALANDVGFSLANAHAQRIREQLLRINQETTGHRLLRGSIRPGAVDVLALPDPERLSELADDLAEVARLTLANTVIRDRFTETAVLTREQAHDLGCLGYVARASGLPIDARLDHPILDLPVTAHSETRGDVLARYTLRRDEYASATRLAAHLIGDADLRSFRGTEAARAGHGGVRSGVGIVEGWRGTIVHRVEIAPDGRIARAKIVDPSWFNWPAVPVALADTIVPDFPLTNKSFNLSYAGNDL